MKKDPETFDAAGRPLMRHTGGERFMGLSYCELQSLVEQAIALAVEEGVGAPRLGYSYPGQAGFLQRAMSNIQQNYE